MNRVAGRAAVVILLTLLLIAGFGFFVAEYVMEAASWAVFPGSPHVYNAGNMGSGVVTDRDGILLLNMTEDRQYSSSEAIRKSTLHWVGDPYGNISAPAVPNYSTEIVGFDLLNGLYSYGKAGGVAELTLSARVQTAALEAMGSHKGTVAVYNYKTGEILCAVTTPTYDPLNSPDVDNDPDGIYEGVYMNRFTQSSYTPGSIFKIVTLTAALDTMENAESMTFTCTGEHAYGTDRITCENIHGNQSLKEAFCNSCNCAFAQVADILGAEVLQTYADRLGVTKSVSFDGITTVSGNYQAPEEPVSLAWSAIGQHTDLVNPCSFMTFMGAIAGGGKGAAPYVVAKAGNGLSGYTAKTSYTEQIMDQDLAELLQSYMRNNVVSKYGNENFPGLTVCAKTGTAERDGDVASNAMFAGFTLDDDCPLAFIVCVEEGGYGRSACVPIASKVLAVCREVMEG